MSRSAEELPPKESDERVAESSPGVNRDDIFSFE